MRKSMVIGLSILLLFSIFLLPTSAMTAGNGSVGVTLVVNDIPPNVDVLFVMNNGSPIFSKPTSEGEAIYLPLVEGTLLIEAIQNGNIVDSLTVNIGPKIIVHTSSSGGSSSKGLGVSSKESSNNVAKSETVEKDFIVGKQVEYTFTEANIAIYQLLVTGKEDESKISIMVESLKDVSSLITEPAPGNVYANLNIWSGSSNVENVLVKFRVENTWIANNNVALSDIRLSRYDEQEKWLPLETTKTANDSKYTYFEANTPELSAFAISSISGIATQGTTGTVVETSDKQEDISSPTGQDDTKESIEKPSEAPGFEVLLSILGLFVIYGMRKKNK